MKKWIYIMAVCFDSLLLYACSDLNHIDEVKKWDCTVLCAEEAEDTYIITYSNEKVVPETDEWNEQDKTEWSLQEIESLFLDNAEPEWKLIKRVSVYDFAYGRVGVVLYTTENDTEYVNVAFMDEEGIMSQCGIEAVLDEKTEFTYHGNGEVTFNVCSKDGVKYKQKIVFSKYDDEVNFVSESMEY